jgi:uncharacterized membrane protein YagU involved in acid resistance
MSNSIRSTIGIVLLAGVVAGTIDVGAASLINGLSPLRILRAIASGLLGKEAFAGGADRELLGLLLQWGMSILIAAIYLVATAPWPAMRHRWRLTGVLAGVAIFAVMNYLVVPLSAAPFRPHFALHPLLTAFTPYKFVANLLAMILFGLIIAFSMRNVPGPATASGTAIGGNSAGQGA